MKKKISVFLIAMILMPTFIIGTYAADALHGDSFTPGEGFKSVVDGTGGNFDATSEGKLTIGTDFYIVDYQDTILTYQLTVEVPMYVSLAVVGDGAVAVPSSTAYGFRNYSGYPVNITAVSVNDKAGGWKLVDTLANPKDLVVKLENKNLLDLDSGSQTLSQIPKATTLDGAFKSFAITATAQPSSSTATSGYQFSVSYTLALDAS
ncbi:MAG: hypothetical protein GX269_05330 [Clostridiales bacterium]|nr:hypothetical protein [Clostridiales bacterium]